MSGTRKAPLLPEIPGGQYEILSQIGEGGMAVVYEAIDLASDRRVALKMLQDKFRDNVDFRKRFSLEAKTGAKLQHKNHVTVYSSHLGPDGEVDYYTMELLDGVCLDDEIARISQVEWPFAVELARQVCEGVRELDRLGIIHRDIKPGNIYLTPLRGGGADKASFPYTVKLLDLGICKLNSASSLSGTTNLKTKDGVIFGTFLYMAPEIFRGERPTHAVDIYAIGVLLFRLLTGKHPIESGDEFGVRVCTEIPRAPSTFELVAPIPDALDGLILEALAKDPAARPESAKAFADELSACLALTGPDRTRLRTYLFYSATLALYACLVVSMILLSSLFLSTSEQEGDDAGASTSVVSLRAGDGGSTSGGGTTTSGEIARPTMSTTGTTSGSTSSGTDPDTLSSTSSTSSTSSASSTSSTDTTTSPVPPPRPRPRPQRPQPRPTVPAEDCTAIGNEIRTAREWGSWSLLLQILGKESTRACITSRELWKLRTLAYKETKQFELCTSEGAKVKEDKEVEGWVKLCQGRLDRRSTKAESI